MTVDRGGLRYTIEVSDQFTRPLKRFRTEIAAARKELEGLRGAQTQRSASANAEMDKGSGLFRKVGSSALAADGAINRVSFTFRRLIGIFAVFAAARAGGALFSGFIKDSIDYNSTIEDSQISMASLFTTAGRVRDAQGELLEGAEAFGAAQAEAARQTRLVQAAAVSTTATFQELLRAFQAGIGPGLEAGLKLDEIREITVRVSQAAAALAIPQNQLIEEIRSLLRGTIQARTTIVASVLGITNKDVADAKKTGTLFKFLSNRLEGFKFAADATQQSYTGLLARVKDSFQLAGGVASIKLFDQLKLTFSELADSFVQLERDSEGKVVGLLPNEGAVKAAEAFFSRIASALQIFREGLQQLTSAQIGNVIGALGELATGVSATLAGFIQGLISGLSQVVSFVGAIAAGFGGGNGILAYVEQFGVLAGETASIIITMVAASLLLRGTWLLLGPAVSLVASSVKVLGTLLLGVNKTVGLLPAKFFPVVGLVLGIVAAFRRVFSDVLGFKLTFGETIEFISLSFQELWGRVTKFGEIAFKIFANSLVDFFRSPLQTIGRSFFELFGGILKLVSGLSAITGIAEETRIELEGAIKTIEDFTNAKRPPAFFDVGASKRELDKFLAESQSKFDALASRAATRDANSNTLFDKAQAEADADDLLVIIDELKTKFGNAFTDFTGFDFEAASAALKDGLIDDKGITEKLQDAVKAFIEGINDDAIAKGPIETYFSKIVENFETGLDLIRQTVQQFSSFVADAVVDSLDPNASGKDLREKFAKFLQSIAKLIIQQLVQVAIAKAVLGAFGNSTGGLGAQAGSLAGGLAEGGPVPGGHGVPRMARPKGLDPRDTTPIFAQPGEFMMKLAAVKSYGTEVMDAINRGLIDPSALRGLISGQRSRRHISGMSSRGPAGYAEGGIIRSSVSAIDAANVSSSNSGSGKPTQAVVVGNNQTMEKLLNGGQQAFRRFLQDNAQEFDGILRSGRTG